MAIMAAILVLGIFGQWLAWRINVPAILPLIIIGLIVGPIISLDLFLGYKLIDPNELMPSVTLNHFISLSVGVILFEGGLTLRLKEVRHVASTVRNLILIGPLITLAGSSLVAHFVLGMDIRIALLFGSLIIVTGPTVIGPILRSVHPNKRVATVLKWESILIDPIGALVAVLMYEFFRSGAGFAFTFTALLTFGKVVLAGVVTGIFTAWLLYLMLKRHLIPDYLINTMALAFVMLAFAGAELISPESGLLSVTLMGILLANMNIPELKNILNFKESLTILLISILFIILAAEIEPAQLQLLGWKSLVVFAIVILLIRPLNVFISSIGSALKLNERLFISWIGPRGIVAAAIASIFSMNLLNMGTLSPQEMRDVQLLVPLTFLIILGTVVIQGLSAKKVSEWLDVIKKNPEGFLLLGAHDAARKIAAYLQKEGMEVVLVDTSHTNVKEARSSGLKVIEHNILSEDMADELETFDIGTFMALTSNNELNIFSCRKFKRELAENRNYRLITRHEIKFNSLVRPKYILFGNNADFYKLIDVSRRYPEIKELKLSSTDEFQQVMDNLPADMIPLFLKTREKHFKVILADGNTRWEDGDILVYMGPEWKA